MKGAEGQKECTLCFNLTPYYIIFHIREGYVTSGGKDRPLTSTSFRKKTTWFIHDPIKIITIPTVLIMTVTSLLHTIHNKRTYPGVYLSTFDRISV